LPPFFLTASVCIAFFSCIPRSIRFKSGFSLFRLKKIPLKTKNLTLPERKFRLRQKHRSEKNFSERIQ
jgi:hypothetical protein